ncbi:MAG: phage tail tape measure protein [Nocardioides sp.]|uniref:phage tail tape measure protein n=1 Tax=Nocardioides sp. TaxID=35761 RepID=UPI0039E6DCB8
MSGVDLATAYINLTARLDTSSTELTRQLDSVGRDAGTRLSRGIESSASKSGKRYGSKFIAALKSPLGAITGLMGGIGIASVVKDSVNLEAAFSKTMAQVQVSTNAGGSAMDKMRKLAMKLGADTVFSANEAADAMLELGKAGISTKDIMGGGLSGTLTLAAAGGTSLATAATIASNAMNTFNLKGRDMNKIAAALAGGANASSASVESLGQGLQQVGPGAKNAGLSLQETVAALSAFDAAGIKGSDAGTSLKTMLTRLQPSTKAALNSMKSLGLYSEKTGSAFLNTNGSFKSLTQISGLLQKKLGSLTDAEKQQALTQIFGSDASRAATVLMNEGTKGIRKYIKATYDQSAAQKMAKANMSGTAGAMEQLSGAVETAELALGQALAPTVQQVAKWLSNVLLPAVTIFITQMQKGTGAGGQFRDIFVDLWQTLQPIGGFLVKTVVPGIEALFSAITGGHGGEVAAKGMAGALATLAAVKIGNSVVDGVKGVASTLSDTKDKVLGFRDGLLEAKDKVIGFKDDLVEVGGQLRALPGQISAGAQALVTQGKAFVSATRTAALWVATQVRATAAAAAQVVSLVAQKVAMVATAAATKAYAAAQWLLNAAMSANPLLLVVAGLAAVGAALVLAYKKSATFRAIVQAAFAGVKKAAQSVAAFFSKTIPATWNKVTSVTKAGANAVKNAVTKGFKAVQSAVSSVLGWIRSHWATIVSILTGPVGAAVILVVRNWDKITAGAQRVIGGVKSAFGKVVSFVKSIPGRIKSALGNLGNLLYGAGVSLITGFINGIKSKIGDVASTLGGITNKLTSWKGPPKRDARILTPAGRMIMQGLVTGITQGVPGLKDTLSKVTDAITTVTEKRLNHIEKLLKNKKISKAAAKSMREAANASANSMKAWVRSTKTSLTAIAKQYAAHAKTLAKLKDSYKDMVSSVKSSLTGELDLSSALTTTTNSFGFSSTTTSFTAVASVVSGLAARIKQVTSLMRKALAAGIPKGLVQEVLNLGTDEAIPVFKALLTGSKSQIKSLKADYSAISSGATTAGKVLANAFYGTGIAAQQGILKGLLKTATIKAAAKKLAKHLTKAVREALGIHSPSRLLYKQVGTPSGQGTMDGMVDTIVDQSDRVAAALTSTSVAAPAASSTASSTSSDAALASALSRLTLNVKLGADKRTKAQWYLDGKVFAEALG